jgi:hypothetical protein
VPLQPAAVAWLRIAKADAMPQPGFYLIKLRRRVVELANEWLREQHPEEPPIVWVQDILRHSYASYRDGAGVNINDLAREMGNSPRTIYAHYLNPRTNGITWHPGFALRDRVAIYAEQVGELLLCIAERDATRFVLLGEFTGGGLVVFLFHRSILRSQGSFGTIWK